MIYGLTRHFPSLPRSSGSANRALLSLCWPGCTPQGAHPDQCQAGIPQKPTGLLSPVQDGLLLLLLRAGTAQDAFSGLSVLGLALRQRFDGEGRAAGGVGVAEDTVGRGPLEDADLGWRPRGKALVLDHYRHFGRRCGLSAVGKKNMGLVLVFHRGFLPGM